VGWGVGEQVTPSPREEEVLVERGASLREFRFVLCF
jgi:hypothetical protein